MKLVMMQRLKPRDYSLPERIRAMLMVYGYTDGHNCKDCMHLIKRGKANSYFKCDLTKMSRGAATDWRAGWPACGKYWNRAEFEDFDANLPSDTTDLLSDLDDFLVKQ